MLHETKQFLLQNFDMKDIGEACYDIGIEIHRARKSVSLSQKAYINKVLERFGMQNCSSIIAPLVKGETFSLDKCPNNAIEEEEMRNVTYASLVGSLIYQSNPGKDHWKAAKKVLRYLQGTKDYSLTYRSEGGISWRSMKQSLIASSTMEAEFISCYEATSQALWLRNFILGLRTVDTICRPLKVFCDNSATVFFSKNNKSGSGSNHINIKYLKVRDHVGRKEAFIVQVNTESMIADPMTKGLPTKVFQDHVILMGLSISFSSATPARTRDSRPELSFDIPASPECMSGLAHTSSTEVISYVSPSEFRGRLYLVMSPSLETWLVPVHVLSCDVAGLGELVMSELLDVAIGASELAIDDPKPPAGSYSQDDVRRLSTYVVKLRDIPKRVLVLSDLSRTRAEVKEEPHHDIRLTLQKLSFNCTHHDAADFVISDPTLEDLAAGTPSTKVIAKDEASKKRKASLSGATPIHVAKGTRSAMSQSSRSTTRANLFANNIDVESDDDEDACVEIPLVTPISSAVVIPTGWNQGGDSRGKAIMTDATDISSEGSGHSLSFAGLSLSFRDLSGDAIHMDFFPFSPGPYYATYPEDGVVGSYEFSHKE
ncbi:retrovirus-related pol polyprotein from transposon TNT 1-94 [Tanacetum coccineum]